MNFSRNPKRALIFAVSALVLLGFGLAQLYFSYQNNSVDPRIKEARKLYSRYDAYAQENNFIAVFNLLDSIEAIYNSIPYYSNSFEKGVLYNNRSAAYLSMALYFEDKQLSLDGIETLSKDTLLFLAEKDVLISISIYESWLEAYKNNPDENSILDYSSFILGLSQYSIREQQRFVAKRIKELKESNYETPRRLSVAYTNLGILKRHHQKYDEAMHCYNKALELWERNLAAENNLNLLLGEPLKKRHILEKIFPPERKK